MQPYNGASGVDDDPNQNFYRHCEGDDDEDDDPSRRRIVMIQDENGNAIPMNMGNFVYDSVHAKTLSENTKSGDRATRNCEDSQKSMTAVSDSPYRIAARSKSGMASQGRGVHLSSSSEEENTPGKHFDHRSFTNDDDSLNMSNTSTSRFVDDDSTLNQEETPGKFVNQFMRIEIEASKLKDVSAVRKDLDHDRQDRGSGPRIMVGLQRMMSSTKDGEQLRPTAVGGRTIQKSASGLQRTSSFVSGIHRTRSGSEPRQSDRNEDLENSQDGHGKAKRQGISAIGRVLSINRNKTAPGSKYSSNQNSRTENKLSSSSMLNPHFTLDQSSLHDKGNTTSTGGFDNSKESHSQQSLKSGASDRPRNSDRNIGGIGVQKRMGISQVGRLLSRNRAKSSINITANLQNGSDACRTNLADDSKDSSSDRTTAAVKPRASLSKIGRMISLKRSKAEPKDGAGEQPALNNGNLKISPMSSSTVSSTSMGDINSNDRRRDRDRGKENISKGPDHRRESRLNLRNAGRMFSLTRRSALIPASGDNGLQRKITLSGGIDNATKETGKGKKESVSAPGTSKVDKFVNSEVTSEAIVNSGVLGGLTHIRVAVVAMAEFSEPLSRDKWFIDVFTLPHNAVRRECMDLYDILSALARCDKNDDLCKEDIDKFEIWWKVANQFLRCYFEVERRVLFPWVDSAGAQEWEVQLALKKMRSLKDKLETLLSKMERVWKEKTFKTSAEMYGLVYKAADEFVPRLVNYFMDQEVLLPAIVKEFYSRDQRVPIDKQMVEVFMNEYRQEDSDETRHNLVLLVRWMNKSRQLRAWLGKNLSASARAMYPSWYQLYEEQHAGVLHALRSRATTTVTSEHQ